MIPDRQSVIRRFCILAVGILQMPAAVRAEDEQELLALVKAGHRSAQESIHSLSCTVVNEYRLPKVETTTFGRYWRSLDRARVQAETPTGTDDWYYLDRDSEVRRVIRNRPDTKQPAWLTSRPSSREAPHFADVWRWVFGSFDNLLRDAKDVPRVKRERIDGRQCIRVSITLNLNGPWEKMFWFDVGRNYLIWKTVVVFKDSRDEVEVEFVEPQPGVFFPTRMVGKSFRGRELVNHGILVFTDLRVNEPIPKDVLEIPRVPRGTICNDYVQKQKYLIDDTWQKLPESSSKSIEMGVMTGSSGAGKEFVVQSTTERRSWTRWIAPASLALLVLAGSVWLLRRNRAKSLGNT